MSHPRKLILTAALAVCGVVYAAAPLVQEGMVQPTEHHQRIVKGAGHWEGTIAMQFPGMPESESECAEDVTAIGDLWTTSHFESNVMGMPFSGASTLGYDPEKEMYVGTWIDSMTTTLTVMEGKYDEAKKAIVMDYKMADGMGGVADMRSYTVHTGDSYTCTFYVVAGGEETEQMKISMTRKGDVREAGATK